MSFSKIFYNKYWNVSTRYIYIKSPINLEHTVNFNQNMFTVMSKNKINEEQKLTEYLIKKNHIYIVKPICQSRDTVKRKQEASKHPWASSIDEYCHSDLKGRSDLGGTKYEFDYHSKASPNVFRSQEYFRRCLQLITI